MATDPLEKYKSKRNFTLTTEPAEGGVGNEAARQFVIQKHWASSLHYDLRLELDGTMKSWAVPKGPSFDPADKRMAIHVEDHPISYNTFEGVIPAKQYGAGKVIVWDKGTWVPIGDAHEGYAKGNLKFEFHGHKLQGRWALIRIKSKNTRQDAWLLIKEKDPLARPASEFSVVDELPDSVAALPALAAATSAQSSPAPSKLPPQSARKASASTTPSARRKAAAPARSTLPPKMRPVLATLVDKPPAQAEDWLFEIKFDGYRMLARIDDQGQVRLFTRNGHDWTSKLESIARQIADLHLPPTWLDGEIVVLNANGAPDFQALQNAFDLDRQQDFVYFLFDLPFHDGIDLTGLPLVDRRAALRTLLADAPSALRFSDTFDAPPQDMLTSACQMGLEGIIGKRKSSPYTSTRSADWIKLKCGHRQEFVIGGWTDPKGSRQALGAILVGVHDEQGRLVYAGGVGTGFNNKTLVDIHAKLQKLAQKTSPFAGPTEHDRQAHWVKPTLLAEVTFSHWTQDGHLRHPVFHALRDDKPAKNIIRERPQHPQEFKPQETRSTLPAQLKISHPDRVVDASTGITKIELIRHYGLVGPLMTAHLKGRPVSLVRAPSGIEGQQFFQKHLENAKMTGIRELPQSLDPDHEPYMEVATALGLLSAAQMNVVEFHTWNATRSALMKPDRITFDLDPGAGVDWKTVQQGAQLLHAFLGQLGLAGFLKTSGGKGLHVVVPIRRQHDWDTVKAFSQAVVAHLAATLPQLFVAKMGPRNRVGKIFVDYLRNGFGATTVSAWSARVRPGMGVSVPCAWAELGQLTGGAHWTVRNIHRRLDQGNAPWDDYSSAARSIGPAIKMLKPAKAARR